MMCEMTQEHTFSSFVLQSDSGYKVSNRTNIPEVEKAWTPAMERQNAVTAAVLKCMVSKVGFTEEV